jgi:uncharacterized protein (DUF1501 family)
MRVGCLTGLGLTLGDLFALQRAASAQEAPAAAGPAAQSVIYIFLQGGMSHFETFDPKPNAPIEYRGQLGAIGTNTGDQFGGLMRQTATVADKLSVIRSMTHTEAAHERGTHNMLTGYAPSPVITFPSIGSVVAHELGPRNNLPPYCCVPTAGDPYLGTGYLSSAYGPFALGGEPNDGNFQVRDLSLPGGVDETRMARRRSLREAVDAHFAKLERSDGLDAMDAFYQRAYSLISSAPARAAFDIRGEPDGVRNEYGRTPIGQRLLMARRLVEAGVRLVTVMDGGWDHHIGIHGAMNGMLPPLDQAFATLIRDLDRRGLLKTTLVVMTTEFGRTPRLNKDGGRDHWPKVFSIVMAGGGIVGGRVLGSSDSLGTEPANKPVRPSDMAATLFTQLGIAPEKKLLAPGPRPIDIVREGRVLRELL